MHSVTFLKECYVQPQKPITAHMQVLLDMLNPLNTLSSLQSCHDAIERHMRSRYIHTVQICGFIWRSTSSHHLEQTTSKDQEEHGEGA